MTQKLLHEICIVVGKTGCGKTYWTNKYLWGFDRVVIYDPLDEYEGKKIENLEHLIEYCQDRLLYRVRYDDFLTFNSLCQVVYNLGDLTFVVEESQRIFSNFRLSDEFKDLIYRGRHNNINLVIVAQRASTIPIDVRSQYSKCISYLQTEPRDIDWLYALAGDEEILNVSDLEKYQYYEITPKGIKKIA